MNTKDFIRLGIPLGEPTRRATDFISKFILAGGDKTRLEEEVKAVLANPSAFTEDGLRGEFAKALLKAPPPPRSAPVKYRQWGEGLEHEAVMQMEKACLLPVAVAGALMPDAHVGYGLPIGGVLATENTVIPYAVGVDIACRMKMTVLDLPARDLERHQDRLTRAIEAETRFGVGATFRNRRQHEVMDADWDVSPVTKQHKDRAWAQLGTSGSGNHFVEFGLFTSHVQIRDLEPGTYVALLSHSGSRGTGAVVCDYYSKIAFGQFPDLPSELKRLAWLSLDSEEGQEYWAAMDLMGRYAAANHALIHKYVAANLGVEVLLDLENHHNFAWKERHVIGGVEKEVIVHRKGATPAGQGVLGIIPGSMASPGFVVTGKGNPESLNSASHGAGRVMSRKAANEKFNWKDASRFLRQQGVTLISAGLDEVPMVYKNIHQVMAAQSDLVTILGQFDPKLVKMAPAGEWAEDWAVHNAERGIQNPLGADFHSMKFTLRTVTLTFLFIASAATYATTAEVLADGQPKLIPGSTFRTTFPELPANERELVRDRHFQGGFYLLEPKPGKRVVYGELPGLNQGRPVWDLAQWSSRSSLEPNSYFCSKQVLVCSNSAKSIVAGRLNSAAADLSLAVNASREYPQARRSSAEPWVHLLIQQDLADPPALGSLTACNFHLEARLKRSRLVSTNDYSPTRHAAQYFVYLTVANRNHRAAGFGECFWFGVPVYDDRHRVVPAYEAQDFGETKLFIFTPASDTFARKSTHDGEWVTFEKDLLPLMRQGLEHARAKGFIKGSADFSDYRPLGIFIGWEVPGMFDVDLQIRNLSLKAVTP